MLKNRIKIGQFRYPIYLFVFAVFIEDIKSRLSSRQSVIKEFDISSSIYSDIFKSFIQYSVSAVSFNAICNFEIKSALLFP